LIKPSTAGGFLNKDSTKLKPILLIATLFAFSAAAKPISDEQRMLAKCYQWAKILELDEDRIAINKLIDDPESAEVAYFRGRASGFIDGAKAMNKESNRKRLALTLFKPRCNKFISIYQ